MALHPKTYGNWFDRILNMWPFMIDDTRVCTLGIAWIFKTIEREQIMPRKTREIQIQVMEYFAQTQGLTKQQLYAANPAYKGMVDINKEIIALRAQL